MQRYRRAGNNERNQCDVAPLRRQSNGRRVHATSLLAPIAFCCPVVSVVPGRERNWSIRDDAPSIGADRERQAHADGTRGCESHGDRDGGVERKGVERAEKDGR